MKGLRLKYRILFLCFVFFITTGYRKPDIFVIDAVNNAQFHNNKGINYLQYGVYFAAVQEFKIAISLSSDTQASASYYYNLGRTYMLIGYPELAQDCFEKAIERYSLDFAYYKALAQCFEVRGLIDLKLQQYSQDKNPLSKVMVGLLLEQQGELRRAIIVFDEFAMSEPDIIITKAVKQEIKKLIKQLN